MAILNLGSINVDRAYHLKSLPLPGETVTALSEQIGLGGKGANQSVAIARTGGSVVHLGAIGHGDGWLTDFLQSAKVDTGHVHLRKNVQTGQAFVMVGEDGENSIVLSQGANATLTTSEISAAIATMAAYDWLLFQNETNGIAEAARLARAHGMKVAFAAAPFEASSVLPLLPLIDLLALNEVEHAQLQAACGDQPITLPALLVTSGARGARYVDHTQSIAVEALTVTAVDTTAAGDTFLGTFLACLDGGDDVRQSLHYANAAAALKVTLKGAATAIPSRQDVESFLKGRPPHI
ncbi:ribokinase [Roseibium aestuarii]|uniref:Ribokinase n=1 Tax=Roseibium aestuarii TaxID=2600299 RepID=A0ABW4JXU1_9HYPH|nr:ribokinase [Roseibium aestuarii]